MNADVKEKAEPCCSKFKLFLAALSFVYFAKAFQGSYMKSSITQIERRFDIPSSLIGVVDGSFEIGNLLVIAFISYFGAKFHRPRLIGAGCIVMAAGSFCIALPHFFQGPYQYETTVFHPEDTNMTEGVLPCRANQSHIMKNDIISAKGCEKEASSSLWIYVFLGNMVRGIGEAPVTPLGLSYLDDFARDGNAALYLSFVHTVGILGPMVGFMLGSFCAKLYVDIGTVDLDAVTITHHDTRWVGAWWLGFLISGAVMVLAAIPFCFLPKSIKNPGTQKDQSADESPREQDHFIAETSSPSETPQPAAISELAKGFLTSLKRLSTNSVYVLIVVKTFVQFNGFIGIITFKPKFMEQVFGQSASKSIFLIGAMNLPAVALGVILGGFVMKRFKLKVLGAARVAFGSSVFSFLCLIVLYFLQCDRAQVGGLTVSYNGVKRVSYQQESLLSPCNIDCSCSLKYWDPVCSSGGVTYASPCLAGCQSSSGVGKGMVFHNCSCVEAWPVPSANSSVVLGQCARQNCHSIFRYYMAVSVLWAFISACGATPGLIVHLRSVPPELKSLAIGMLVMFTRTLGGIPAPIYFGAAIDRTCLRWGSKRCGGRGACRLYDSDAFRNVFLGLTYGLYSVSLLLWGALYARLVKRHKKLALQDQAKICEQENGAMNNANENNIPLENLRNDIEPESECAI